MQALVQEQLEYKGIDSCNAIGDVHRNNYTSFAPCRAIVADAPASMRELNTSISDTPGVPEVRPRCARCSYLCKYMEALV